MVTVLIAQRTAECPRKQEENVELQGVWVFHSVLVRTGGCVFKTPRDLDTVCCSTGRV